MMAKRPDGSGWVGWSLLCGVPATIAGFAIGGPLGLVTLAATISAFKHGSDLEKQATDEMEMEWQRDNSQRQQMRRDIDLPALREAWDAELQQIGDLYAAGSLDDDEYELAMDELTDRWPR